MSSRRNRSLSLAWQWFKVPAGGELATSWEMATSLRNRALPVRYLECRTRPRSIIEMFVAKSEKWVSTFDCSAREILVTCVLRNVPCSMLSGRVPGCAGNNNYEPSSGIFNYRLGGRRLRLLQLSGFRGSRLRRWSAHRVVIHWVSSEWFGKKLCLSFLLAQKSCQDYSGPSQRESGWQSPEGRHPFVFHVHQFMKSRKKGFFCNFLLSCSSFVCWNLQCSVTECGACLGLKLKHWKVYFFLVPRSQPPKQQHFLFKLTHGRRVQNKKCSRMSYQRIFTLIKVLSSSIFRLCALSNFQEMLGRCRYVSWSRN